MFQQYLMISLHLLESRITFTWGLCHLNDNLLLSLVGWFSSQSSLSENSPTCSASHSNISKCIAIYFRVCLTVCFHLQFLNIKSNSRIDSCSVNNFMMNMFWMQVKQVFIMLFLVHTSNRKTASHCKTNDHCCHFSIRLPLNMIV